MVINGNVDANTAFYNSLGYIAVERFYLGENNPAWDDPPVPIDLVRMVGHLIAFVMITLSTDAERAKDLRHAGQECRSWPLTGFSSC